jgi:tetratricopeptide (TPR) repeat protein
VVAIILLIGSLASAAVASRVRLERDVEAARPEQELLYLPNGRYLKFVSLGQAPLVADIVYLWAIQFYSNYTREGRYRYVEHIFGEVIPELDPMYIDPYWLGAMILSVEVKDVDGALRLLEQGFENNPEAWILPYLAGWEADRAGMSIRAAEFFASASGVETAPYWVRRMVPGMLARGGRLDDAIASWREVLHDPEADERSRDIAERWLETLRIRKEIEEVETAVARFLASHERFPRSLGELVTVGLLPAVPVSADGNPFDYDAATGRVVNDEGRIVGVDR